MDMGTWSSPIIFGGQVYHALIGPCAQCFALGGEVEGFVRYAHSAFHSLTSCQPSLPMIFILTRGIP